MGKSKGKNKYVPEMVIKELEIIKTQEGFDSDLPAFNEMARRSKLGAEIEKKMKNSLFEDLKEKKKKGRKWSEFDFPL